MPIIQCFAGDARTRTKTLNCGIVWPAVEKADRELLPRGPEPYTESILSLC